MNFFKCLTLSALFSGGVLFSATTQTDALPQEKPEESSKALFLKYSGENFDKENCLKYYEKAIEEKFFDAANIMGKLCMEGTLEGGLNKALEYFKFAAEKGNALGMFNAACVYEAQDDFKNSAIYLKMAADAGDVQSMSTIGRRYVFGEKGVEKNLKEAFYYINMAAEKGDIYSMRYMGNFYEQGLLEETDFKKAFKWFYKAAEKGDEFSQVRSALYLIDGRYVEKNDARAIELLKIAAKEEYPESFFYLGTIYLTGECAEKDEKKAFKYFQSGARLDEINCLRELSICYRDGVGTEKDLMKTYSLMRALAELGDVYSQYSLAVMLSKEEGFVNYPEAVMWLEIAAKNGNEEALKVIPEARSNCSNNELKELDTQIKDMEKLIKSRQENARIQKRLGIQI